MTLKSIEVRDEKHWHELRRANVGASEVAAILGMSKWKTKWRLYQEKRGALQPDNLDKDGAVQTGKHMEAALAQWAAEKFDWPLRKVHRYIVDTDIRAGASLDYETAQGERVPVEVKFHTGWGNDDPDHQWDYEGDTITQAPVAYLLQVQHQMMLTNASCGWLVAFVGGSPRRMLVPRSESVIAHLRAAIAEFWRDVDAAKEPPMDWFEDADGIAKLLSSVQPDTKVDLADDEARRVFAKFKLAKRMEDRAKRYVAECKGQLWMMAGDAAAAFIDGTKIDLGYTGQTQGKLVTEDMIGTYVGARDGFRRCQIRPAPKPKKSKETSGG